jgi:hypothetical protein
MLGSMSRFALALLLTLLLGTHTTHAETRTVDATTYSVPDGATTIEAKPGSVTRHTYIDEARGTYLMLMVYERTASAGGIDADFAADWAMVAKDIGKPVASKRTARGQGSWKARAGRATYTYDGKKSEVIVVTYSDGVNRVSAAALTSAPKAYKKQIDAFLASVKLAAPSVPAMQTTPAASTAATTPAAASAPARGMRASDFETWHAVEEASWVTVTSLRGRPIVARVHADGPDDGTAAWQQLIAPRYPNLGAVVARTAAASDGGRIFLTAQGTDGAGAPVHVALYRRPGWPWIELVTADRAALHQILTTIQEGSGTSWSTLDQLARFTKEAPTGADLVGTWNLGGAGTLVVRADGTYSYQHLSNTDPMSKVAKQFAGENLAGTYYKVSDWDVYFRGQSTQRYPWAPRLIKASKGADALWLSYGGVEVGPFTRGR